MSAQKQQTKVAVTPGRQARIFRAALVMIECRTRGYSSLSTMGVLNEIARIAIAKAQS